VAKDNDEAWRRMREREDERDEEERKEILERALKSGGKGGGDTLSGASGAKFEELAHRAEPLIEQVNNLYQMYATGLEPRPPMEQRKMLDQLVTTMATMGKPTPAQQFRFSNLQQKYTAYKDRWERLLKDIESGKIKRITGAKRG